MVATPPAAAEHGRPGGDGGDGDGDDDKEAATCMYSVPGKLAPNPIT